MQVVGLILTGGAGSRLGGIRKGDLRLSGMTLRDHLIARLQPQCGTLLHSVSAGTDWRGDTSLPPLPDDPEGPAGPAAGLYAGARWCRDNAPDALMLSVSVDTPFLPADFAVRTLDMLNEGKGCVVGAWEGRTYPTNALWRPIPLLALLSHYPAAPRGPSLRDLQDQLEAVVLDYAGLVVENPFAGVNTLADHLALSRRLAQKG